MDGDECGEGSVDVVVIVSFFGDDDEEDEDEDEDEYGISRNNTAGIISSSAVTSDVYIVVTVTR